MGLMGGAGFGSRQVLQCCVWVVPSAITVGRPLSPGNKLGRLDLRGPAPQSPVQPPRVPPTGSTSVTWPPCDLHIPIYILLHDQACCIAHTQATQGGPTPISLLELDGCPPIARHTCLSCMPTSPVPGELCLCWWHSAAPPQLSCWYTCRHCSCPWGSAEAELEVGIEPRSFNVR